MHLLFCVGMTAEEFIIRPKVSSSGDGGGSKYSRSRYQLLQETIASWLNVPVDNVNIFTVLNHPLNERTIDVRYAAHGSPYYRPAKLNGMMTQYKSRVSFVLTLTVIIIVIVIQLYACVAGL